MARRFQTTTNETIPYGFACIVTQSMCPDDTETFDMPSCIRRFFLAALPVAALVLVTTLCATAADLKAIVPFAFDVNGSHIDSGNLVIGRMETTGFLLLVPENGPRIAVRGLPLYSDAHDSPKLVFARVDGKCYLTEIRFGYTGLAKRFPLRESVAFTAKNRGAERIEVALGR